MEKLSLLSDKAVLVKHRFEKDSGTMLSGGQQQRLCIGRAIAYDPKIVIMDEPCSALDPIATAKIENLMGELSKQGYTIAIVTHSMQQAARTGDRTAFMYLGLLEEINRKDEMFLRPQSPRTQRFLGGQSLG